MVGLFDRVLVSLRNGMVGLIVSDVKAAFCVFGTVVA